MANFVRTCELAHLGGCGGPIQRAHIIGRGRLRNVAKALNYCDRNAEVLLGDVCASHNVGRVHDEKKHRAYLLHKRVELFGWEYVDDVIEGLRALHKVPPPELRLEALLGDRDDEAEA